MRERLWWQEDAPLLEDLEREAQRLRRMSYSSYLQTDHWKEVRQAALDKADGVCRACKKKRRLQVHHRTYERLGRERPSDLVALCSRCHAYRHPKVARKLGLYGKRKRRKKKAAR